ncbi:hypothetical protein IMCC21906_01106 [Spongiibacter sp. IMCC21906]|jgi:hypothetical protein|uniref:hypothetical protein n=1 Tax=Spongiibacter sp. IMCC21906 TaxID=1620392 RepID=UPI00062DFD42|nr:hypothetical protein [Spongiibacter sp. IMCC21906]AKH68785.1 hypothetical protein IMCC21906_01106 [Spongiibacter sp. IMCC21906]
MPAYVLLAKIAIAASVIGFASWLADKKPVLAGFLVALPLVSILAILFSYLEHRDAENSITFAKSIMIGVPVSYFFFLPFFFAERLQLGFWGSYLSGLLLLVVGYFVHRSVVALLN